MSYQEPYEPLRPPEIRHPREQLSVHEFFVNLGVVQPEVTVLRMMADWLSKESPRNIVSINMAYLPETDVEPARRSRIKESTLTDPWQLPRYMYWHHETPWMAFPRFRWWAKPLRPLIHWVTAHRSSAR